MQRMTKGIPFDQIMSIQQELMSVQEGDLQGLRRVKNKISSMECHAARTQEDVDRIIHSKTNQSIEEIILRRRPEKEVKNELYALMKEENTPVNPKLARMMLGKEFSDKGYSLVDLNGEYATVEIPSGLIRVHLRHGTNEFYENLEFADNRKRRHGYGIDLCEKLEDGKGADSFNRTLQRFEEYKMNDKQTVNSIDRNIRDASHQATVIILKLPDGTSFENIREAISNRGRRSKGLEEIIIILNDREAVYTRTQFTNKHFQIKKEDFK